MKRIVLFIIALMPFVLFAQPRVDGDKPVKIIKSSQVITNPIGWAYDEIETRKWCGYYGGIFPEYRNNNKKAIWVNISSMPDGYVNDNTLISMQIKKTVFDSTAYYLLYIQDYFVDWDYPTIYRGRHIYKRTTIYVMDEDNYNNFMNPDTTARFIALRGDVSYCPNYLEGCKNERTALTWLNDVMYFNIPKYSSPGLRVKKENDNTIRFNTPHSNLDFEHGYFEVSAATFNKLKIQ